MKLKQIIILSVLIIFHAMGAWGTTTLRKTAEWPFSPPTLFLHGGVNAVESGGDFIFWALGDTVVVIDKASYTVSSIFRIETSTSIQDMLFDDPNSNLYIAAGYDTRHQAGGLQIYSLTDPADPILVTTFDQAPDNPGAFRESDTISVDVPDIDARALGLYNGTLYLADDNFGLRAINVTDPSQPVEILLTLPEDLQDDERISGYKQPDVNGSYTATGGYVNMNLYPFGGKVYAFVLDFYHGIKIFDVTNPAVILDPVIKDTLTSFWYGSISLLSDLFVTVTGGRLTVYISGTYEYEKSYAVSRMDISDVNGITITNFGRCIMPGNARSLSISGSYAYVADGDSGLQIVDIFAEPAQSDEVLEYQVIGEYTTNVGMSYSILADPPSVYMGSVQSGLSKLDVSTPSAPTLSSQIDSPLTADDIFVEGDYTYMLDHDNGLRIFDSSEHSYALLKGFLEDSEPSTDVVVSGNYAYLSAEAGDIKVADVTDPSNPFFTGVSITSPAPMALCVSENILSIADSITGLHLVDIQDPLNPVDLGSTPTTGPAQGIFISDNHAYIAEGPSGIEIFDITTPSSPVLKASAPMDNANSIAAYHSGDQTYLLVADGNSGVKILNISDLSSPLPEPASFTTIAEVTETDDQGTVTEDDDTITIVTPAIDINATGISVLEDKAYVAIGDQGVLVLNISTPDNPVELTHYSSWAHVSEIIANMVDETPYITLANGSAGIKILYLYDSTKTDISEDLVPTIDSGCFISTPFDLESQTGWGNMLLCRVLSLLSCDIMTGETL
ncbi:MAG: hypothetical protein KKD44_20220 [Proteobacteria bacterium]|nr:hypothetical protein [Pseudomonadota bacterium]